MDAQETLNTIKSLLFDEKTLQDVKRIELLEQLSDRVHLYYMDMKRYESFVSHLKLPEVWLTGEAGKAFDQAARSEHGMFAIMHELDALKRGDDEQ